MTPIDLRPEARLSRLGTKVAIEIHLPREEALATARRWIAVIEADVEKRPMFGDTFAFDLDRFEEGRLL